MTAKEAGSAVTNTVVNSTTMLFISGAVVIGAALVWFKGADSGMWFDLARACVYGITGRAIVKHGKEVVQAWASSKQ